jgi:hypothetical protein
MCSDRNRERPIEEKTKRAKAALPRHRKKKRERRRGYLQKRVEMLDSWVANDARGDDCMVQTYERRGD